MQVLPPAIPCAIATVDFSAQRWWIRVPVRCLVAPLAEGDQVVEIVNSTGFPWNQVVPRKKPRPIASRRAAPHPIPAKRSLPPAIPHSSESPKAKRTKIRRKQGIKRDGVDL